jgi:hypothetical protein
MKIDTKKCWKEKTQFICVSSIKHFADNFSPHPENQNLIMKPKKAGAAQNGVVCCIFVVCTLMHRFSPIGECKDEKERSIGFFLTFNEP